MGTYNTSGCQEKVPFPNIEISYDWISKHIPRLNGVVEGGWKKITIVQEIWVHHVGPLLQRDDV